MRGCCRLLDGNGGTRESLVVVRVEQERFEVEVAARAPTGRRAAAPDRRRRRSLVVGDVARPRPPSLGEGVGEPAVFLPNVSNVSAAAGTGTTLIGAAVAILQQRGGEAEERGRPCCRCGWFRRRYSAWRNERLHIVVHVVTVIVNAVVAVGAGLQVDERGI